MRRLVADKFRRIQGVSDPQQDVDRYWCHFAPPKHPKDAQGQEGWTDGELAQYLVRSAAVLTVKMGATSRRVEAECSETFEDGAVDTWVVMRARAGGDEVTLPVCGHRGVRSYLPPTPLIELATRAPERVFRTQCSTEQWACVKTASHTAAAHDATSAGGHEARASTLA